MTEIRDKYKEELKQFLLNNYLQTILEQFNQPKTSLIKVIQLTFDLSLIIDTRPLLGSWIINFYPHFLNTVNQIIYSVVQSSGIGYEEFMCELKFIAVPSFDTALHDPCYKLSLIEKKCGSLIHIKNAIIVNIDNPKNYLYLQEFQCQCAMKISLVPTHLINRLLMKNEEQSKDCADCGKLMKEISRKYKNCQKIQLFIFDLSPFNSKYGNQKQNQGKYKHKFQLMDLYLDCNNVNKFQIGQQIYSLAYYAFDLQDQHRQNRYFLNPYEYCYAVTIDQYSSVNNKKYFSNLKQQFRFNQSQQINGNNQNEDIRLLLDSSRKHYNYCKDNQLYVYEILQTTILIANSQATDILDTQCLFHLKLSLLLSIFLENSNNIPFYLSSNLCGKSNLLVQRIENEFIQKHIHVAIIHEDKELILDIIKSIVLSMENVIFLPDCDEETFDFIVLNIANGGILIVTNINYNKQIQMKLKQILKGDQIQIHKSKSIKIQCSIWWLFEIQELKIKKQELCSLNDKFSYVSGYFDIIVDTAYSNLSQKQVRFDILADQAQQQQNHSCTTFNPFQTTIKKQLINLERKSAPSSCYLYQKQTTDKNINSDLDSWLQKLDEIDHGTVEMLQDFYLKLRNQCKCNQSILHSLFKISSAISIMRYFVYSQVDDSDGLSKYLLNSKHQLPLSYADGFLSILLIIETRINNIGPIGALFGSDTTNYLCNIRNDNFQIDKFRKIHKENAGFDNFSFIYDKILNY